MESKVVAGNGGHYSITFFDNYTVADLVKFFENGPDEMNFVLFSTSGVHGTYCKIENIEEELSKGEKPRDLTFVIVQPRVVALKYGNIEGITKKDIPVLKKLRAESWPSRP